MKRIYIDIDSLLDTRLGLLQTIDPELVKRVVVKDAYWHRNHTNWDALTDGGITTEKFDEHWAARTSDILPHSMMTDILAPLKSVTLMNEVNILDGIVKDRLALTINIWPYNIGIDVQEALTQALHHYLMDDLPITYIDNDLTTYTPVDMINEFEQAFMFDFHWWLRKHAFALSKVRAPGFTLILPRLLEKDPSDLTLEEMKAEIFQFQMVLRYYIDIDFIDARCFSMYRPKIKAKAT